MATIRVNGNDVEALAVAVFGSPDRTTPNPALAAQPGDRVVIAGGVFNVSSMPNVNQGLGRHMPLLNPVNNDVEFFAEGPVEIINTVNGQPNPIAQSLIGSHSKRVRWLGDFILDEKRATPRPGAGLVVAYNTDLFEASYTYEGMPVGDPRHWADNHVTIFAEYARNVRLNVRARDVHSAPGWARNGSAIMLYGCDNVEIYEPLIEDSDQGINVKGTFLVNGVTRINNTNVRIIRPTFRRITASGVALNSVWGGTIEQGRFEDCPIGIGFFHLDMADDHPQSITVSGVEFARCGTDVYFKPNNFGFFQNIRIEVLPGTNLYFEGNDNTGWCQVVDYVNMARLPTLPDAVSARYDAVNNTLISRETEWKTEVGDRSVSNRVAPHLKVRKWADTTDECWLSISFADNLPGNDAATFEGEALVWSKAGYRIRMYNTGFDEGGGHNFDLVIPRRPPVNTVTFNIAHSGCRFEYQPPLTAEEIETGHVRPPRVVGSYAVFRADNRRHNQYQTGKVCHIYRPHLVDSAGSETWADMNITGNQLTITIPQAWLDAAVYPVTLDPDLGYTTIGATAVGGWEHGVIGTEFTASENGTTTSMSAYLQESSASNTHTYKFGMYASGGGAHLGETAAATDISTTAAWKTLADSTLPDIVSGTAYLLAAFTGGGGGDVSAFYDTDATVTSRGPVIGTYPTWPALSGGTGTRKYSIYLTYTAGGAASAPKRLLMLGVG